MKILDEKGKVFSRINVIDFLILLLIIGVFLAFYAKSMLSTKESSIAEDSTPVSITYLVNVRSVRTPTVDSLKASIGKDIYADTTKPPIGKLEKIDVTGAEDFTVKDDGSYVKATIPDKYDVVLTLTVDGMENDDGIFREEDKPLLLSDSVVICTEDAQTSGEIIKISSSKKKAKK